ncbi:MAG: hypothetical protein OXG79_12695 [Chloroflexi bacterium]|nr:hypothetical protein [Chloroflexota bacterium]
MEKPEPRPESEPDFDDTTVEISSGGETVRTTHGEILRMGENLWTSIDVPPKTAFEGIAFIECPDASELAQALLADLENEHLTTLRHNRPIIAWFWKATQKELVKVKALGSNSLERALLAKYDAEIADVSFVVTFAAGLLPRSIGQRHLEAMCYHALRRMEFDDESEEPALALYDYGAGYLDEFEKYGPWNSHMAELSAVTDTEPTQAVMPLAPGAAA